MSTPYRLELELDPISPNTVSSGKDELLPTIEHALKEEGLSHLLVNKEIDVFVEKTFPVDAVIVIIVTMTSQMAVETYKKIILPKLQDKFLVKKTNSSDENKDENV